MNEIQLLRRKFASECLLNAVNAAQQGRLVLANQICDEALEFDAQLSEAHAVRAKIQFWMGAHDDSERSISEAARNGYCPVRVQAMRASIEELRSRAEKARIAKEYLREERRNLFTSFRGMKDTIDEWITTQRLTILLFLMSVILFLGVAQSFLSAVHH